MARSALFWVKSVKFKKKKKKKRKLKKPKLKLQMIDSKKIKNGTTIL